MTALDSILPGFPNVGRRNTEELLRLNEASAILTHTGNIPSLIRLYRPPGKPSKRPKPSVLSVSKRRETATKIQAWVLGVFARHQYHRERNAAKLIQSSWRGCLVRRHEKKRAAAWRLTNWATGRVARLRYVRKRAAARRLQEFWRFVRARRHYKTQKYAARKIESEVAARKTKLQEAHRQAAALYIQRAWRRKLAWLTLRRRHKAAIAIQKSARRWLAVRQISKWERLSFMLQSQMRRKVATKRLQRKKLLQSMLTRLKRCGDASDRMLRMREASLMIGSTAKMHLTILDVQARIAAAIQIQRVARGYLARRYVQKDVAPLAVQNFFRCRKAHEVVEKRRAEDYRQYLRGVYFRNERRERQRNAAATRIQASVRMHRHAGEFRSRILWAVTRIHGLHRMIAAKNTASDKLKAIIQIQAAIRRALVPSMSRKHDAATDIQSWWRGHLVRQNLEYNEYLRRLHAVIRIQAMWRCNRMYIAHQHVKYAVKVIQAQMRTQLAIRAHHHKHSAAIQIQSVIARPFLAKRKVAHRIQQVFKLQAFARRILSRKHFERRVVAATKIQSLWRMSVNRQKVLDFRPDAAIRIQARFRGCRARGDGPGGIANKRRRAAARLQAFIRSCFHRHRSKIQHEAARCIQGKVRYRRFRKAWAKHRWLIFALQRIWRARCNRVKTAEQFRRLRTIPGVSRGYMQRTMTQPERDRAVVTIQRVMRGALGRMRLAKLHASAVKLQAWWRSYQAVRRYKRILWAKHRMRGLVFRWRWNREMHEQLVQDMEMRSRIREQVIRIQKHERRILDVARIKKENASASKIQGLVRGVLVRQHTKKKRSALQYIQADWDRAYQRGMFAKRWHAAVQIQAFMRGRCTRRKLLNRSRAIFHLQRIARSRLCRKREALKKSSGHLIMRVVRSWLVAKRYRRQLWAIKLIQRIWRGSRARGEMSKRHAAATKIESRWKGILSKRRYSRVRSAGDTLFAGALMYRHIRLRKARVQAATRIQAVWRGYCERLNQEHLHLCAYKISKWYRDTKVCNAVAEVVLDMFALRLAVQHEYQEQPVRTIQRTARTWLRWRRGMHRTRRAITRIQARYRAWVAKREVAALRAHLGRLPPQHAYQIRARHTPQIVRIVDLNALTPALRGELELKVLLIQAAWRAHRRRKAVFRLQRMIRGGLARRHVRRMRAANRTLVCWWRRVQRMKREKAREAKAESPRPLNQQAKPPKANLMKS